MSATSFLLILLMMWGVVLGIYAVLFFPELMQALRHEVQAAHERRLHHLPPHIPHAA